MWLNLGNSPTPSALRSVAKIFREITLSSVGLKKQNCFSEMVSRVVNQLEASLNQKDNVARCWLVWNGKDNQ